MIEGGAGRAHRERRLVVDSSLLAVEGRRGSHLDFLYTNFAER